jgi:ABC-type antimicrobial peptide transport system permease subunit
MSAVRYRFVSELRHRATAWIVLGVIVGLGTGALLAATAGARRTSDAYDRFIEAHDGLDAIVTSYEDCPPPSCVQDVERLDSVAESVRISVVNARGGRDEAGNDLSAGSGLFVAAKDGRLGTDINRWHVTAGRAPRPDAADEVIVTEHLASALNLHVGDTIEVDVGVGPEDAEEIVSVRVTIVGLELAPNELEPLSGEALRMMYGTPALIEERPELFAYDVIGVRLRGGADAREAFVREAEALDLLVDGTVDSVRQRAAARERFSDDAGALVVFAVLGALATIVLCGQALVREQLLDAAASDQLRAVGMGRTELRRLALLRSATIAAVSAVVAVATAITLSPLAPVGEARAIEIDRGVDLDLLVLVLGALAIAGSVLFLGTIAAERVLRSSPASSARRPPIILAAIRRLPGLRPRLAATLPFERAGRNVPTASVLTSIAIAVGAVVGASTFSASLTHLQQQPALFGKPWDAVLVLEDASKLAETERERALVRAGQQGQESDEYFELIAKVLPARAATRIADDASVAAVSVGDATTVDVGSVKNMSALALDPIQGDLEASIISGRTPRAKDEIAVGTRVLNKLHVGIGDSVDFTTYLESDAVTSTRRIVGRSVTAYINFASPFDSLGGGVVLPGSGGSTVFIRLAPGEQRSVVLDRFRQKLGMFEATDFELGKGLLEVDNMKATPDLIVALTAFLGAATLLHFGLVAARRHSRHLAVLRSLGMRRRDCVGVLAWHGVLVATAAIVIGTPLGVAVGRVTWLGVARGLYVVPVATLPSPATALIVFVVVGAAVLAAIVPGWLTTRAAPGITLARDEVAPAPGARRG